MTCVVKRDFTDKTRIDNVNIETIEEERKRTK